MQVKFFLKVYGERMFKLTCALESIQSKSDWCFDLIFPAFKRYIVFYHALIVGQILDSLSFSVSMKALSVFAWLSSAKSQGYGLTLSISYSFYQRGALSLLSLIFQPHLPWHIKLAQVDDFNNLKIETKSKRAETYDRYEVILFRTLILLCLATSFETLVSMRVHCFGPRLRSWRSEGRMFFNKIILILSQMGVKITNVFV